MNDESRNTGSIAVRAARISPVVSSRLIREVSLYEEAWPLLRSLGLAADVPASPALTDRVHEYCGAGRCARSFRWTTLAGTLPSA